MQNKFIAWINKVKAQWLAHGTHIVSNRAAYLAAGKQHFLVGLSICLSALLWVAKKLKLDKAFNRFVATPLGQKMMARLHHTIGVYRKLTSPPPDPLMAALAMQGQQIDIDEDPTELHGNKLFMMIGAFVVIAILWAAFTELDEVVRAEGAVVPPSSVQLIQNRLPGSVISIRAKLGDRVEKNQVLFRLEDEDVIANFDDNEIARLAAVARVVRLSAEADGEEEIAFPEWMEKQAPDVVANERDVFNKRRQALETRSVVIRQQIREHDAMLETLNKKVDIFKPLVEAGHEARLVLVELQGERDQMELAAQRARDEYDATLSNFRAEAARELSEVRVQADQAGARDDAFRAKVRHADVRASTNGVISAVHIKTVGAVVQAGTVMAEIVPDERSLLVRARVLPQDIASVHLDQLAHVSLSAYDAARFGNLEGRVQRISSNTTQEDPAMLPYYETIIEIPDPRFSKRSREPVAIVPGMTAVVDIVGRKRTVLNYIFTPLQRAAGVAFREN